MDSLGSSIKEEGTKNLGDLGSPQLFLGVEAARGHTEDLVIRLGPGLP